MVNTTSNKGWDESLSFFWYSKLNKTGKHHSRKTFQFYLYKNIMVNSGKKYF